ncbi:MAG: hypothetical protein AAGA35_00055 [Patescibacteria group bacterium]
MKSMFVLRILLPILLLLPAPVVFANVSVSPLLIDKTLETRDIISETITITNNYPSRVVRMYASVNEITVGTGGEILDFQPPATADNTTSITSWVEISRARMELQPGESREVPVRIKINPNAQAGDYHAFIGLGDGRNRTEAEAKIRSGGGNGVLVKITLAEERNEFLKLARFFIDRFVTSGDNNALQYEVTNPSNVSIVPTGEVIFYNSRGEEVESVVVNPEGRQVEPGKSVLFEGAVPMTDYFGRHKAFLSVEYGEGQLASVHDTTFFYIVPVHLLVIIFATLLVVSAVVTVLVHRRYTPTDGHDDGSGEVLMFDRRGNVTATEQDYDVDLKPKSDTE